MDSRTTHSEVSSPFFPCPPPPSMSPVPACYCLLPVPSGALCKHGKREEQERGRQGNMEALREREHPKGNENPAPEGVVMGTFITVKVAHESKQTSKQTGKQTTQQPDRQTTKQTNHQTDKQTIKSVHRPEWPPACRCAWPCALAAP